MAEYAEILLTLSFLEFPHFFRIFCVFPRLVLLDAETDGNGGIRGNFIDIIIP